MGGGLIVGWFNYACVYAGFALLPVSQAWGIRPLMAIYGDYMALTVGVGKAQMADHAPSDCRGTAMGIFYGLTGLTTLIASLSAGFLWDRYGARAALLLGSVFVLLANNCDIIWLRLPIVRCSHNPSRFLIALRTVCRSGVPAWIFASVVASGNRNVRLPIIRVHRFIEAAVKKQERKVTAWCLSTKQK